MNWANQDLDDEDEEDIFDDEDDELGGGLRI